MLTNTKKNVLAVALMAGLGMAGTASAYSLKTGGDALPVLVATADIIDGTTDIGINENFVIALDGTDNILGRTTGFTIRYTLNNGATFGQVANASDFVVGPAARFGLPGAWSASIAAGGGLTDNYVTVSMNPGAPADCDANAGTPDAVCGLTTGDLLTFIAANAVVAPVDGGQVLDTLTALQTAGQQVIATIQFIDPVTSAFILTAKTLPVLKSGDPVVLACDTGDGDTAKRIDVGVTATQGSKTYFSSSGAISGADENYINLGSITTEVAAGFTSFAYAGTDEFQTVVTGDFSAFSGAGARDVFLSTSNICATNDVNGVISNANGTVTFDYVGSDVGINANGFIVFLCANVPAGNTVQIDASAVSETTTFTRGSVVSNGAACDLLPLRYNGSVVEVYHLNPAGQTTAQSFVRIINPSDLTGTVTLTSFDDLGNPGATPITFTLLAGHSMQLNSDDFEVNNPAKSLTGAWGNGTGKWRATVTGEFPDMVVQSLNRNLNDGTVTNLTDADNRGEQFWNGVFNNN